MGLKKYWNALYRVERESSDWTEGRILGNFTFADFNTNSMEE